MLYIFFLLLLVGKLNAFPVTYKRITSDPYISGDSFRAIANHLFDETTTELNPAIVRTGDIIFVKTDYLNEFFSTIHPHIKARYIIITHNSDYAAPRSFTRFLDDDKIIAWFGQNPSNKYHPKFIGIPIGLANQCWDHGNIENFKKAAGGTGVPRYNKRFLLGINFRPATNYDIRRPVFEMFINKPFCTDIRHHNHLNYLQLTAETKFILCPEGNGLDCHRTWEALYMGAIPILTHSNMDPVLEGLPILIIDDWNQLTQEFLEQKYEEIFQQSFHWKKMYFTYWKSLIESYKNK